MMWKDFFYFTKFQRIGIMALVVLILLIIALNMSISALFSEGNRVDTEAYADELQAFKDSLLSRDSLREAEWRRQYERRKAEYARTRSERVQQSYTLFRFDPNTADSLTFVRLGLPPWIASNIVKYRLKGGRFRQADDLRKIYGLSGQKFDELRPYIDITPFPEPVRRTTVAHRHLSPDSVPTVAVDSAFVVDLNSADTLELMKVRGIGSYYAREIVRFRNRSGGFVSVEQLLEIKYMRPENYERMKPYCVADTTKIKRIEVNRAGLDYLKRHPYINFYQAKVIYEFRRAKGRLKGMDDLRRFEEFTEEDIRRLTPYLSFE